MIIRACCMFVGEVMMPRGFDVMSRGSILGVLLVPAVSTTSFALCMEGLKACLIGLEMYLCVLPDFYTGPNT